MNKKIFFFVSLVLSVGMVSAYGQTPTMDTMRVQNTNYSISYQLTNGQVTNATALVDAKSILILVSGSGKGVLTVTIPRTIMDAKVGAQDSVFIVSDDGVPAQFQESKTDVNRTLTIPFSYSTNPEKLQITGTQIVPEFGTIASLVLIMSIISMIILSAKTKLLFMPRF